ncbi:hypothetical protein PFICI_12487 [Pestalotiopsis fici W106-1]|uniref:F-box domain-containing protein n=1 Tax=Pestalotiopsis fici (strain W106-1 / CGMCC3.15140) TaxID=1229662 RepID=W3WNV7_PESFW|nr:uncharacterized protein PFICI_12487 [Pestalotiopsis fici W106-1]ETS75543.1 hypothetical protein PFICI_12487 [Pestalotiopsis fici W106-1]
MGKSKKAGFRGKNKHSKRPGRLAALAKKIEETKEMQRRMQPFRLLPYHNIPGLNFNDPRLFTNQRQETTWSKRDKVFNNGRLIISFHFLARFTVADIHVQELLNRRVSGVHRFLQDFRAGSLVSPTFQISEAMAIGLAKNCPALKQVRLLGACELTDKAIAAFLQYCTCIAFLEISGTEDQSGNIRCPGALRALGTMKGRRFFTLNHLRKLVFCNQSDLDIETSKALTERCPGLELTYGNTRPDLGGLQTLRFGDVVAIDHMTDDDRTGYLPDTMEFEEVSALVDGPRKTITDEISGQLDRMVLDD